MVVHGDQIYMDFVRLLIHEDLCICMVFMIIIVFVAPDFQILEYQLVSSISH